jgi:hypothetical protein
MASNLAQCKVWTMEGYMGKIHGLIITDEVGRLVVGPYGDVLLFKSAEDAEPYKPIGGVYHRVITAKVRRPKPRKEAKQ